MAKKPSKCLAYSIKNQLKEHWRVSQTVLKFNQIHWHVSQQDLKILPNCLLQVADIFTLTGCLVLLLSSIGYVDARPQSPKQSPVTCSTIEAEIKAQQPFNVTCDPCTESVRTVTVCGSSLIYHVCRNTSNCEEHPVRSAFDISKCSQKNPRCYFPTGCKSK